MEYFKSQSWKKGGASELVRLTWPVICGNILLTGYQLTDTFWVGRLGAAAVAAVAICLPILFLTTTFGSGLAVAGTTLCSQYLGAMRHDMVNHIATQTLISVSVFSLLLGLLGYTLAPYILRTERVSWEVYSDALSFIRILFGGLIFLFVYGVFQALMRSIGRPLVPMFIVLGTVVLNFALDPLFIFGIGPLPGLGVAGAALATVLTQMLAVLMGIFILADGRYGIKITWDRCRFDRSYFYRAVTLGLPSSIEQMARGIGPTLMSILAISLGTTAAAAYGIGISVLQLITIPAIGISASVSTLVGRNIGAGNKQNAIYVSCCGAILSFTALSALGLIANRFAPFIIMFFIPADHAVIRQGAKFLEVMSLAWGAIGVQLCLASAIRAAGNLKTAMAIALLLQLVIQPLCAYALSDFDDLGPEGLWLSFPIVMIAGASICLVWFLRGSWVKTSLVEP